jgi:tetratricopeptide (TPR) repeat protein
MISRRAFSAGLCSCLAACVTHQTGPSSGLADAPVGYRPDLSTDEAGLWMHLDKVEQALKTSQARIRDKAINDLVADVMCRLTANRCPDLRTYVVRIPAFNATCAPNGMVQVWSGLLLRCETESELAAILGHEFGHYLKRHSLMRMRDARERGDFLAFLSLAGGGVQFNNLATMLSAMGQLRFSRDNERESDEIGFRLMTEAGYDPAAGANIWRRLVAEMEAGDREERFTLMSTHPATSERIETLTKLAEAAGRPASSPPNRLPAALAGIRGMMLSDEINVGHFKQTEKLFDMLLAQGTAPGEVIYYRGELYRRRGKDGDEAIALGYYHEACESAGAPPEAFRSVGLIRWRRGEKEQAKEYFRRYLTILPEAGDHEMIKSYLAGA